MPHKGTVDSLRNIVVEFLAESLHKYSKVNLSHRFIIHSPENVLSISRYKSSIRRGQPRAF